MRAELYFCLESFLVRFHTSKPVFPMMRELAIFNAVVALKVRDRTSWRSISDSLKGLALARVWRLH